MRYMTDRKQGFYWENESDPDNAMSIFLNQGGGLSIAISDEKAMDSYNQTFECAAFLNRAEAERLRDFLIQELETQKEPRREDGA